MNGVDNPAAGKGNKTVPKPTEPSGKLFNLKQPPPPRNGGTNWKMQDVHKRVLVHCIHLASAMLLT